ncbi:MAG: GIY-YIG nuclease family protein [Bacteroidales bacterium]|nr:GIY-YIG nuclease family protein [Bacteroidales bacterium]
MIDTPFFIAMTFYTYILFSESLQRFYYGQCNDLEKRLERHNRGYVRSTRCGRPWELVAYKQCITRSESMKLEKQLKNLHSSEKLKRFIVRHDFKILLWRYFD